jgi:hypothetical protein
MQESEFKLEETTRLFSSEAELQAIRHHVEEIIRGAALLCPIFCTSWIVSVAQLLKYLESCRMGCGELGSA